MVAVTTLPQSRPLTWRDLEERPDDGHRYELIDGALVVTPAPIWAHQRCMVRLTLLLGPECPAHLGLLSAPFDVRLAADTVLQPDLLIARRADLTIPNLPKAPVLAIEVLSPSTRLIDLTLKKARYEAAGCRSYWVIDPAEPSIRAWVLRESAYVEIPGAAGESAFETDAPFPVTIVPGDLVR